MARQIVLGLAVIVIGEVLGANVYTSWVDARNWAANIPSSLTTPRDYFALVNPGSFFRAMTPVAQLLALLALIVCWKVPGARIAAAIALALTVTGDVMTFAYFLSPQRHHVRECHERGGCGGSLARLVGNESRAQRADSWRAEQPSSWR